MVLRRTIATANDGSTTRVAKRAFLVGIIVNRSDARTEDTYVHPTILRNSADALHEAEA